MTRWSTHRRGWDDRPELHPGAAIRKNKRPTGAFPGGIRPNEMSRPLDVLALGRAFRITRVGEKGKVGNIQGDPPFKKTRYSQNREEHQKGDRNRSTGGFFHHKAFRGIT